jgi:hypothetical protein
MRDNQGRFQPGHTGNPNGRPLGSKHKLGESFFQQLFEEWKENGKAALSKMRKVDNTQFVKMVASLQPKDFTMDNGDHEELTSEELENRIAELANDLGFEINPVRDK